MAHENNINSASQINQCDSPTIKTPWKDKAPSMHLIRASTPASKWRRVAVRRAARIRSSKPRFNLSPAAIEERVAHPVNSFTRAKIARSVARPNGGAHCMLMTNSTFSTTLSLKATPRSPLSLMPLPSFGDWRATPLPSSADWLTPGRGRRFTTL